jgi:hypothetical protein
VGKTIMGGERGLARRLHGRRAGRHRTAVRLANVACVVMGRRLFDVDIALGQIGGQARGSYRAIA